jgi:hypothetical protein
VELRLFYGSNQRQRFHRIHGPGELRSRDDRGSFASLAMLSGVDESVRFFSPFQQRNLEWFPRMRTSSLDIQEEKNKEDQEGRIIKIQMDDANKAIRTLSLELSELQKLVRARRTNEPMIDCLLVFSSSSR